MRRQGELEGAEPASNEIKCPAALPRKARGEQSEDFHTARTWESNGIFQAVEKVW